MEHGAETLSLEQVADLLKVGVPTVQSLINRGLLGVRREGEQQCVLYRDVLAFLRADQQRLRDAGDQPADLGLLSGRDSA